MDEIDSAEEAAEAEEEEEGTAELEVDSHKAEGSRRRRRRRVSGARRRRRQRRRRASGAGDCQGKVNKLQEEVDGWHDDCYDTKAAAVKSACDKRKDALKKLAKYKKIAKGAKAASSSAMQSALKALGFLPWGVGKILKAIAKALKIVHPKAKSAE